MIHFPTSNVYSVQYIKNTFVADIDILQTIKCAFPNITDIFAISKLGDELVAQYASSYILERMRCGVFFGELGHHANSDMHKNLTISPLDIAFKAVSFTVHGQAPIISLECNIISDTHSGNLLNDILRSKHEYTINMRHNLLIEKDIPSVGKIIYLYLDIKDANKKGRNIYAKCC